MLHTSAGDPEGRRLAKRRAALLSEAAGVVRAAHVLLRRADFDVSSCEELLARLAEQEMIEIQRSLGRIESRKRFKGHSSQPLLEGRPIITLHLDESGKSFPEPDVPCPQFFSIGAIAMTDDAVNAYKGAADEVKQRFFGTAQITFHEPDMRQRKGPYYFDGDEERQRKFDAALVELIQGSDFVAFGVGVRKTAFEEEFAETGADPYLPTDVYAVVIMLLLERYVDFLAHCSVRYMGRVVFDSIGPREDAEHQLHYTMVLLDGSQWVPHRAFQNWLEAGCVFVPKCNSHPTELADILSRDIFEWVKSNCEVVPKYWSLFSPRFYCRGDGLAGKFGLKVFPDADIRDNIEAHRRSYGAKIPA